MFGTRSLFLTSKAAFAADSGVLPASDMESNCPAAGSVPEAAKPKPVSLAVIPIADQVTYWASALGISSLAIKTGSYWIGFVYAAAFIIGVRMASFPAPN